MTRRKPQVLVETRNVVNEVVLTNTSWSESQFFQGHSNDGTVEAHPTKRTRIICLRFVIDIVRARVTRSMNLYYDVLQTYRSPGPSVQIELYRRSEQESRSRVLRLS